MRELSLFTGAGGGILGTSLLGWQPVGYVEWDDYCQRVLRRRMEDGLIERAPIYGDIRTFISEGYAASYKGMVDVITAGFPCQDVSIAWTGEGSGQGLDGERSGLWQPTRDAIDIIKPGYVQLENSPALVNRGLGDILRDLAAMGYDAKWGCISASQLAAFHRRERIWIVAYRSSNRLQGGDGKAGRKDRQSKNAPVPTLVQGVAWSDVSNPNAYGSNDGLADRVDRTKAVGNGQVPAVVRAAWEILTDA